MTAPAPDATRRTKVIAGLRAAAATHERLAGGARRGRGGGCGRRRSSPRSAAGGKVLVFGNGGSAADAQHVVAELVGRFVQGPAARWPAVALTTDTSILTAVGNDFGFDQVFARQIEALGPARRRRARHHDQRRLAQRAAGARDGAGARAGHRWRSPGKSGGAAGRLAEIHLNVPETVTARVQEAHTTMLHLMCELVDDELDG